MKHYRIKPQYSLDPLTGFPELHYALQERKAGIWLTFCVHRDKPQAEEALKLWQEVAVKKRDERLEKRRARMRKLSGAMKSKVK